MINKLLRHFNECLTFHWGYLGQNIRICHIEVFTTFVFAINNFNIYYFTFSPCSDNSSLTISSIANFQSTAIYMLSVSLICTGLLDIIITSKGYALTEQLSSLQESYCPLLIKIKTLPKITLLFYSKHSPKLVHF